MIPRYETTQNQAPVLLSECGLERPWFKINAYLGDHMAAQSNLGTPLLLSLFGSVKFS